MSIHFHFHYSWMDIDIDIHIHDTIVVMCHIWIIVGYYVMLERYRSLNLDFL